MTTTDYATWINELHHSRRFGDRDRIGTANLIDTAARRRATDAIVDGTLTSLARPLRPQTSPRHDGLPGFKVDVFYTDGEIGMGSDHVEYDCHGNTNTHLDALNHLAVDGTWYCGWGVDDPDGPSVTDLADHGLVT